MFTKSVAACLVSSVLVSVGHPESLFAAPAQIKQSVAKRQVKVSVARSSPHSKFSPLRLARSQPQSVKQQQTQAKAKLPSQQAASIREAALSAKALHLGTFAVRAYTHYRSSSEEPGKTAIGTHPMPGRTVAVDPKVIPFGTKIYIEGVGERIAEDRGGSIRGKQIDVFLPTAEHCRRFGRQLLGVQVMVE